MTFLPASFARAAALLVSTVAFVGLSLPARADDGEAPGPGDVEQKVREQMQKIVDLMRENERALLKATESASSKPTGVDVKPPDVPPTPAMTDEAPAMETSPGEVPGGMGDGAGPTPPERGGEIRRDMEKLIDGVRKGGQQIPREIEELIRMIPTQGGGGQGKPQPGGKKEPQPESGPRKGEERPEGEKPDEPKDGEKDGEKKPDEPAKGSEDRDGKKPPSDGEKGEAAESEIPPWDPSLPPEWRKMMTPAEMRKVPDAYRPLVERYQKWLIDHPGRSPRER